MRTKYDRVVTVQEAGSSLKPVKKAILDEKGRKVVVESGEPINQYAFINSFRSSTDLNVLIARYRAGDTSALEQRAAAYCDISNLPDNINDYNALHYQLEQYFNTLPARVRSVFDNSLNVFINNYGTDQFNELMKLSADDINKNFAKESKELDTLNKNLVNPGLDPMTIEPITPQPDAELTSDVTHLGSVNDVLRSMKR